jgi:hypothetical protein
LNGFRSVIAALRRGTSGAERKVRISDQSTILVYELTTASNAATAASVGAVVLTVLDSRPLANLVVWTVAATAEQALRFRGLPWIITPRQRRAMVRVGNQFEFQDPESGDLWSVSIETLDA